jgi:hypothetical protein
MTKVLGCGLAALLVFTAIPVAWAQKAANEVAVSKQGAAANQNAKNKGGLSDRTVRILASYAWAHIPDEVSKPDGTRIPVRGVDIDKFMLSLEDTRRIVMVAERSAQAKICGMNDMERANHDKMMKVEQDSKRWSNEQLAWIHWLHEITVKVRVFDPATASKRVDELGLDDKDKKKALDDAKRFKKPTCNDEKRKEVRRVIEEFVSS